MERPFFGLVRSKQKVCFCIVILFLFFQIVPLAVRNAAASVMPRIAAGGLHSIAMKTTGAVWTWGNNMYGQLGNGKNGNSNIPVLVKDFDIKLEIGRIYGYVADISGGTLDSVKLRLTAKKGKTSKSTQSDNNGYFEFKDVPENTYYIRAQKEGYKRVKSMVVLRTGEIKEIKIDMKLKPLPKT